MTQSEISIAPMMGWTDRHARFLLRLLSQHVVLYTEMVTTGAILHGPRDNLLKFNVEEHPVVVQLGGNVPDDLAQCAVLCEDYGYDEININIGCPSDRVQSGAFGACLMANPSLVAECVSAMQAKVDVPVTVKCRVGIDEEDSYEYFANFVDVVSNTGCKKFIVHARNAWLQGLSPKENRDIPPLRYDYVHRIKQEHPELHITINGGIKTTAHIQEQLQQVDGVMIGREAYHNPYMLADVERSVFGASEVITREAVVDAWAEYIDAEVAKGEPLKTVARHVLGLYHAQAGSRLWRRFLSENMHKAASARQLFEEAAQFLRDEAA